GGGLGPAEYLLDALAAALADRIAAVAGRAAVDGAGARPAGRDRRADMAVDGHVRGHVAVTQVLDERAHVMGLVGAQGDPSPLRAAVQHLERRLPLGEVSGLGDNAVHGQAVAVLHQGVTQVAELGGLAAPLAVEPRLRIRSALVRFVGALFGVEAALGIAPRAVRIVVTAVLPTEALHGGPGSNQRAVHDEISRL